MTIDEVIEALALIRKVEGKDLTVMLPQADEDDNGVLHEWMANISTIELGKDKHGNLVVSIF